MTSNVSVIKVPTDRRASFLRRTGSLQQPKVRESFYHYK